MGHAKTVSRKDLDIQNGAVIDGVWRDAGIIQDLRAHQELNHFIPAGLAITWVSLKNLAPLDVHIHPIESFVAIMRGRAKVRGEDELILDEGQVAHIPSGRWHGFEAVDENGFWGVAWQFAETHLFDATSRRLVFFPGEPVVEGIEACARLDSCLTTIRPSAAPWLGFTSNKFSRDQSASFAPEGRELWMVGHGQIQVDLPSERIELSEGDILTIDPGKHPHTFVRGLTDNSMLSRFEFQNVKKSR